MAETIAAIATGEVRSAIGILRISGDSAIAVADKVFRPKNGGTMSSAETGKLVYGGLYSEKGELLDMCLCTVSRAPHSYTGEDTAEIQCHGSPIVLSAGLSALFAAGARQAKAGEFTKRAFLNGKMDLTGAEAVIDLIDAQTVEAAKNASGQLSGAVFKRADAIYSKLLDMSSHFHAVVDYPDEDIEEFELENYISTFDSADRELSALLDSFSRGRFMREGVKCAIVGRPNVGKSSLMNALVGYDRAIVTDVAGTTRDTIEEKCVVGDVLLRLIDTAGIRNTADTVEKIGVERSRGAMEDADMILVVTDMTQALTDEDREIMSAAEESCKPMIVIANKKDLAGNAISAWNIGNDIQRIAELSAKTGEGIEELSKVIHDMFAGAPVPQGEILTNARQADAVGRALGAIRDASDAMKRGVTPDVVLTQTEEALAALGELTGKTVREDITARIFERFCVGK